MFNIPQFNRPSLQDEHFVYIVLCVDGSLYTGYAKNVVQRVVTHNAGKGAKYTRSRLPVSLQAFWSFQSKSDALRAERAIKKLSHVQKLRLCEIAQVPPGMRYKLRTL